MTVPAWPISIATGKESDLLTHVARGTRELLTNNLTIADNLNATFVTLTCTDGVETLVPLRAFRTRPKFFQPIYSQVSTTDPAAGTPVLGTPQPLNYARTDGYVGVTVQFNPLGPYAEFSSSGVQSINNATLTVVSHQTSDIADTTGVISITSNGSGPASSRITVSQAGIYEVVGQSGFASNATGYRQIALQANAAGNYKGLILTPTVNGDVWSANYSTRWSLAANDYVQVTLWQNSGAALNTVSGATSTGTRVQVRRVGFLSGYSPTVAVTGIMWGG